MRKRQNQMTSDYAYYAQTTWERFTNSILKTAQLHIYDILARLVQIKAKTIKYLLPFGFGASLIGQPTVS
jgi:hypothetical protein